MDTIGLSREGTHLVVSANPREAEIPNSWRIVLSQPTWLVLFHQHRHSKSEEMDGSLSWQIHNSVLRQIPTRLRA